MLHRTSSNNNNNSFDCVCSSASVDDLVTGLTEPIGWHLSYQRFACSASFILHAQQNGCSFKDPVFPGIYVVLSKFSLMSYYFSYTPRRRSTWCANKSFSLPLFAEKALNAKWNRCSCLIRTSYLLSLSCEKFHN